MKTRLLDWTFVFVCTVFATISAEAKVWRVNKNTTVPADFREISTAAASAQVSPGDTIYAEGASDRYAGFTLRKKLTIIGPGYFLSGANGNTGLQHYPYPADLISTTIDTTASGSVFIGMSGYFLLDSRVDNLTFTRCELTLTYSGTPPAGYKVENLVLNKCYAFISLTAVALENLQVTNCILGTSSNMSQVTNGLFRNNVCANTLTITNSYVTNNIFLSSASLTGCTVKHNIASSNILPAGNNNINSITSANIFTLTGSTDGRYTLRANSPAIGHGEPLNGITPDAGAFGTPDPYRLSGIPPIPTIYNLLVPAEVPATSTTMSITLSTRSNN